MSQINSGVYIITYYLNRKTGIQIGKLGAFQFEKGYYYYVGSALKNLQQRIDRHLRKEKTLRWHIDYLSTKAKAVDSLPIYTTKKIECKIAQQFLSDIKFQKPIKKFGSSDCRCETHLFYTKTKMDLSDYNF